MATTYYFEEERLKPAVAAFLNSGCNFNEVSSHLKKQMRLFMQEDIPTICLSDGKHYIESHFTKDAINDFRKNYSNVKFSNLREKILVVTKWRFITRYEDSRTSFCSYQNISIHLIVENFRPLMYEKVAPKCFHSPCIFRDADIQCLLKNKRQEAIQQQIIYQHFFMHNTDIKMPSAKDIFESESQNRFKKLPQDDPNDQLGIMMTDLTEEEEQKQKDMLEKKEFERNLVLDFNKQLLQKISSALVHNEVVRCEKEKPTKDELVNDREDFKEMRDIIMNNASEGMITDPTKDQNAQYYDVKRLQIQEKGEDEYYFLFKRKQKQLQDKLDDEITRNELTLDYEHFHNQKDKSRLEFQRQMQIKLMQNAAMKLNKKTKKVISYRLGYSAADIKDRILRFMTTFNPTQAISNEETYLEEKNELTVEQHRGAYSQIDRNEMTDIAVGNISGGLALSQYYQGPQSIINEDLGNDTESEPDEDPITYEQKQKVRSLVSKVKPTISLFKRYYEWFNQHEVTTKSKYEELQENLRRAIAEAAAREAEAQKERERKEQLAREREAQLLEAQRQREEQAELERQRKIERKALKLKQQQEEEERKQREFEAEVERQRQQELALEQERQRKLLMEREAAELKRNQEIAEAAALIAMEQEKERQVQLEIAAAAESLRKIKIEEERRKLQEEAAKAKHEEALKQQKLDQEREQARLLEEARIRAEFEEAQKQQRILEEQQTRIRLEAEAALLAEQARQQDLAEKRRIEELAMKERERQKQLAAQEALKKEQERQERRRIQLEQEAQEQRVKYEEEKRLLKLRQEEELRRAKQEAEIERNRYEEQLRIENELRRKREQEQLAIQAIEALSGKSLKSNSLSQKSLVKEEETGLNMNDESSEEDEDNDQQTAAFIVHSQEEEFSPEQIEVQQQVPEQAPEIIEEEEEDQSPQLTPNKDMTIVYPQPSPGSFVDQNPIPQPYDESLTLADLVGQHQNGSQQLKPSTSQEKEQQSHRHHSKKHKRSQSSHSNSKKHLKKRKNRSSSSESSSSEESKSESKSLSSISREESDVDSSEQRSSRSGSSSENSSDSQRGSSSESSSSSEQRQQEKQAKLLLALLNPKKSSKSKKDKKQKHKGKADLEFIANLLRAAQTIQSKSKKDRSSKKHHKSSAQKHHHNHHSHSQSRVKDEKPQSVQKIPQPFTLDHQLSASPNLEIKQSPSPQKPGVNYSYKHLDSTQGSTEPQVKKQLSPVEIVKTTHRVNAMTTSFDSWKQQNENQNGQNFQTTSPQQSQSKVIPPWNQSRDEEEDNSEQIALLLAQDKTLQKRRRHE